MKNLGLKEGELCRVVHVHNSTAQCVRVAAGPGRQLDASRCCLRLRHGGFRLSICYASQYENLQPGMLGTLGLRNLQEAR